MLSPQEQIVKSEQDIDRSMPAGYTKQFVEPPWKDTAPRCRGCGKDPVSVALAAQGAQMAFATFIYKDKPQKKWWYSFGLVCVNCNGNMKVRNRLMGEIFLPLDPSHIG
jgi:hypothetical protein